MSQIYQCLFLYAGVFCESLRRAAVRLVGALFLIFSLSACDGVYVGYGTFYDPWWYYHPSIYYPPVIHPPVVWGFGVQSPCNSESTKNNAASSEACDAEALGSRQWVKGYSPCEPNIVNEVDRDEECRSVHRSTVSEQSAASHWATYFDKGQYDVQVWVGKKKLRLRMIDTVGDEKIFSFKLKQFKVDTTRWYSEDETAYYKSLFLAARKSGLPFDLRAVVGYKAKDLSKMGLDAAELKKQIDDEASQQAQPDDGDQQALPRNSAGRWPIVKKMRDRHQNLRLEFVDPKTGQIKGLFEGVRQK